VSDPQTQALIDRLDSAGLWAKLSREFYAEGTFTPSVVGSGGGSATYTSRSGRYVRVGAAVYLWVYIEIATTTLSGSLSFAVPFTSATRAIIPGVPDAVNLTASYTTLYGLILGSSSEFRIREAGDNVATSPIQGTQIAANTIMEFAGAYEATA
jgi:hypothetical protein